MHTHPLWGSLRDLGGETMSIGEWKTVLEALQKCLDELGTKEVAKILMNSPLDSQQEYLDVLIRIVMEVRFHLEPWLTDEEKARLAPIFQIYPSWRDVIL